ncbi:MAG: FAD:protein FMN transferase [Bacteroidetes bacterium]|nr:FAD:protein FMN transferase [Bacteroidota bacterium]
MRYRMLVIFLFLSVIWCAFIAVTPLHIVELSGRAQGTKFSIKYVSTEALIDKRSIDSVFAALDASLSRYVPHSTISRFNRSDRGICVDRHVRTVVEAALQLCKATEGAFDITTLSLTELWKSRMQEQRVPTTTELQHALQWVGPDRIQLKGDSLVKIHSSVRIDVDGIAQGYSVDCLAAFLRSCRISSFLIELGGEVFATGTKPNGERWSIGVARAASESVPSSASYVMGLNEMAATTSGRLSKYSEVNGQRYSHIIDPQTGLPIHNEMMSATVVAHTAMEADALDNAFMVMGLSKSLKWLESRNGLAFFAVIRNDLNQVSDTCTDRFRDLLQ